MASKKLIDMLNMSAAREIQVSIQYIWQHIMCKGMESEIASKVFEDIAIAEMKHYEKIAERIDYLGGDPTTKPTEIKYGKTIREMLEIDKAAEEDAIKLYRQVIELAEAEKDYTTKVIFEGILKDEEDHHYKFSTLLEKE